MTGTLYIVGTPIGNLSDMSPRAIETMKSVDFIAAEDSRVTMKLLSHFDIKRPVVSYYEHNKYASGERILERLLQGESCALVTDAGMPAISDPGTDLVQMCAEKNVNVIPIPGPCAVVTALAVSGLPSGRFTFEGFLPAAKRNRLERLRELSSESRTMVFYEAPHKLIGTLSDMLSVLGDRRLSISRELTKMFEETRRETLSAALEHFKNEPPRGEFVLVLEGREKETNPTCSEGEALELLFSYRSGGRSLKESARLAAAEAGYSKNHLYSLALKKEKEKEN